MNETKPELIDLLPAGREIDALVAEVIFSWRWIDGMLVPPKNDPRSGFAAEWDAKGRPDYLPAYSVEDDKAFKIVDVLSKNGFFLHTDGIYWFCDCQIDVRARATAPTRTLAICRAAIKSKYTNAQVKQ